MELFVFNRVVLKLLSIESLYCSINEEVIDPDDTRYRLLHDCASAILSLQRLLSSYCSDWCLNWSRTQRLAVDKALLFNPFEQRCNRECKWFKSIPSKVVEEVPEDYLPF